MKKIVFVIAVLLLIPSNAFALNWALVWPIILIMLDMPPTGQDDETTFSETLGVVVRTH